MPYKIADFLFDFENPSNIVTKFAKDYFFEAENADYSISITSNDLQYEDLIADDRYQENYLNHIATYRKIAKWLPLHNAFVFHSACFDVNGVGVAFAAHSGTGKTTHMRLWQQFLGEKMVIVNGDKPIVRFFDEQPNTPYAYGAPWNGKERLGCNMRTPLKHICFIERSETNFVEEMNKADAVNLIFNQIYMPKDPIAVMNTMQLIDRLLSSCQLWKIHCNMEPETAKIAYETIFNAK